MITLLSSALGFAASFLPKILGFFQQKSDQKHELKMLAATAEAQAKTENIKLEAGYIDAQVRQIESMHRYDAAALRRASPWVVNLAGSVRPIITYAFFLEFTLLSTAVIFGWIGTDTFNSIWSEEMRSIFAAVVSFWFGQRTFGRQSAS